MIIGAVVGVLVAHPTMQLNAFNGFVAADGSALFPTLFVTIDLRRGIRLPQPGILRHLVQDHQQ